MDHQADLNALKQRKVFFPAFAQRRLRLLALGDVLKGTDQTNDPARAVVCRLTAGDAVPECAVRANGA